MKKRVVITGIGTINPTGKTVEESFQNIQDGKLAISKLSDDMIEATNVKFAGIIKDYDPLEYFTKKEVRRLDLSSQYAIISAKQAAKDANLEQITDRSRIGVNVTSGIGGLNTIEKNELVAYEKGFNKVSPMFIPNSIINLVAGNVAIYLDCKGICAPVVTACASSTDAIGHAMMYIQNGLVDVMVTGGSEATITKSGLSGFENMGALSKATDINKASIPFDKERSGFVMGEGSATLILEEYEHAIKRGAKIYGEVVGYSNTCDANHITSPDSEAKMGIKALNNAIEIAEIDKKDIGYVNAHGTSTELNDKGEIFLLNSVFKEHINKLNITSSKSMTGHLLGATGALEAIITTLSLNEQIITPTINTKNIDESCQANICLNEKKTINTDYGMSVSLGFGGHNSVVIIKKGQK